MQSFPPEELPIISARQVALRVGQENLCLGPKIQNWQNFSQISWNLGWMPTIKNYARPKKLRPKFGAYHAFCDALVPSLALPSGSWPSPSKRDFVPNSGSSCAWAFYFPFFPSPTAFGILGACSSVVESLSLSYDVSVFVSMVFQGLCLACMRWKWEFGCFLFEFQMCVKGEGL